MDNKNNWNWNDGDERRVSSVYRDEDETNAFILINPSQNIETQDAKSQVLESQPAKPQPPEQSQAAKPQLIESQIIEPEPQNIESPAPEPPAPEPQIIEPQTPEPQNIEPQAPQPEPQNNIPQPEFHPIVLPQNTRQNYNDKRQNTNYSAEFSEKDISENKVSAIAAYLIGPIGIIIALLIARDSAYTAFHVRQALKITICSVLLELFAGIFALFGMIPLVGIIFRIMIIITCAAWFGVLVLRLIAIAQVSNGEAREPAVIGNFDFLK